MVRFRSDLRLSLKLITFLDALRWSHRAYATDERDKIFALLGPFFDRLALAPVPNYERSTKVYPKSYGTASQATHWHSDGRR
jgi:hypothetical protein